MTNIMFVNLCKQAVPNRLYAYSLFDHKNLDNLTSFIRILINALYKQAE